MRAALLFFIATLLPATPESRAQNFLELAGLSPDTKYKEFETEHFRFVFDMEYESFTRKAAAAYEHAHSILQPILKWTPRDKTTVLIADNEDAANGFALPSLRVGMVLIATPPDAWFSTAYTEDWIKLLAFHEYTHFLNIDATNGGMEVLRILFGDVIRPNGLWPSWMLEGLATYFETRTSKLGRGRSPYYEGILRCLVHENRLGGPGKNAITLDRVNGEYPYFPGGEIAYLFGYHLWNRFSKDREKGADPSVSDAEMGELSIHASSRIPYFINSHLEAVKGRSWTDYWQEFVTGTRERMGAQIREIEKAGETPFERIAESDYSIYGGTFSPDGKWLAYTENSMKDRARLILKHLPTGKKYRLEEKLLGAGLAFTPDSKFLVFSALFRMRSYQVYSELFAFELKTGRIHELSSGLRGKDPALSPDGKVLAFLKTERATQTLALADWTFTADGPKLRNIRTLVRPKEFSILSGPSFNGNREILFSEQAIGAGRSDLKSVGLPNGPVKLLWSDGFMNRFPVAFQGRIHFISNRSGIDNVHLLRGQSSVQLTQVIGGTLFPFFSKDGTLHANSLSADGYQIVRFPSVQPPQAQAPEARPDAPPPIQASLGASPEIASGSLTAREYRPFRTLAPRQWAPLASFSTDSVSGTSFAGFLLGFDATGKHQYILSAGYNTLPRTLDGAFSYTYSGFRPLIDLSLSRTSLSITPTDYRNHLNSTLTLSYPVFFIRSTFRPSLYAFASRYRVERTSDGLGFDIPDFQYRNGFVPGFGTTLFFTDARKTRLGFMNEIGNELRLQAEARINTEGSSLGRYLFSWSHFLSPGNNHVIQSRVRWIGTTRTADSVLTSSNASGKSVDSLFDRGTGTALTELSFRGYPNLSTSVRAAGSFGLEYHFPLIRGFDGSGTFPAFLKQTHGFIFGDANYGESIRVGGFRYDSLLLPAYGGGLSTDTQLLLRVPVRFNLELQKGTRRDLLGETRVFFTLEADSVL